MMINRVCRLIVKQKGMNVSVASGHRLALSESMSLSEFKSFGAGCQVWLNMG
jgi:hypothetical protein